MTARSSRVLGAPGAGMGTVGEVVKRIQEAPGA